MSTNNLKFRTFLVVSSKLTRKGNNPKIIKKFEILEKINYYFAEMRH